MVSPIWVVNEAAETSCLWAALRYHKGPILFPNFDSSISAGFDCLNFPRAAWLSGLVLAVLMVCPPPSAQAQSADLTNLRAKFELNLAQGTLPALREYVGELTTLEKQAASARDYDTATAVRAERQRVNADIVSQEKLALLLQSRQATTGASDAAKIVLKIEDAKLEGVTYDKATDSLTGWSSAGASATWKLPDLSPGGYEVILKCSSGTLEGGTVIVQEAFYTLKSPIATTLKGFEEQNLGTLKIRDGSGFLKITAQTVLKSNLMQLQSVELLPANR